MVFVEQTLALPGSPQNILGRLYPQVWEIPEYKGEQKGVHEEVAGDVAASLKGPAEEDSLREVLVSGHQHD